MKTSEKTFETKQSKSEADVIEFYDEYSKDWDQRFGLHSSTKHFIDRRFMAFEESYVQNMNTESTAIEFGVGTGVYIHKTSKLFRNIIAVDGSEGMLSILKENIKKHKITNVTVLCQNVVDLTEITDESVDCVYFFGLLEHIVEISRFEKEIYRVLKKGGVVIGVTPNNRSPWYTIRKYIRGTGKHCTSDIYYDEKMLDNLFQSSHYTKQNIIFYGAVPAGVKSKFITYLLIKCESVLEKSFLAKYLGGICFAYKKHTQN